MYYTFTTNKNTDRRKAFRVKRNITQKLTKRKKNNAKRLKKKNWSERKKPMMAGRKMSRSRFGQRLRKRRPNRLSQATPRRTCLLTGQSILIGVVSMAVSIVMPARPMPTWDCHPGWISKVTCLPRRMCAKLYALNWQRKTTSVNLSCWGP